jgi:DhnA family fructose-bisphosphate aldolase class Ia
MKSDRLNRLFNSKSGHGFDVAIDDGFFNPPGFLTGMEDMTKAAEIVMKAASDA